MTSPRILVVQNAADDDARRLGDWLRGAGAELVTVRPYDGEPIDVEALGSQRPAGADGLVVLGGEQAAYGSAAPWFPDLSELLRRAVAASIPTLGVCLGGQLLAQACGGRVERSENGPVLGARLVAKRDIAEKDPLFGPVAFTPDVLQWHADEITVLPPGAVLLAASAAVPNQAFRLGSRAWGLQFHIECDTDMIAAWAAADADRLAALGLDRASVVARADAVMDDLEEVWRPFAERFVALAKGTVASMHLPIVSRT